MPDIPRKGVAALDVWGIARQLVVLVYELAQSLPDFERYGLTTQLRRSSISVVANLAEGYGRVHRGEYRHHVSIARGSIFELETLLLVTSDLGYRTEAELEHVLAEVRRVGKMLTKLGAALEKP